MHVAVPCAFDSWLRIPGIDDNEDGHTEVTEEHQGSAGDSPGSNVATKMVFFFSGITMDHQQKYGG